MKFFDSEGKNKKTQQITLGKNQLNIVIFIPDSQKSFCVLKNFIYKISQLNSKFMSF